MKPKAASLDKPLVGLRKKEVQELLISETKERTSLGTMNVKRIMKEYSEQLYVHKFDNFDEIV